MRLNALRDCVRFAHRSPQRARATRVRSRPGTARRRRVRAALRAAAPVPRGRARARRRAPERRDRAPARITGASSGASPAGALGRECQHVAREPAVGVVAAGTPACGPARSPCPRSACAAAARRIPPACRRSRDTGASAEVFIRVPMPKPSIGARAATSSRSRYSSRLPLAKIVMPRRPPASRIARTRRACSPRSPLSMRTPLIAMPSARETARRARRPCARRARCRRCRSAAPRCPGARARSARTPSPRRRGPGRTSAPSFRRPECRTRGRPRPSPCPANPAR